MEENLRIAVDQAIADFDGIELAIEESTGVDVPTGVPTSEYDELIHTIPTVVSPTAQIIAIADESISEFNLVRVYESTPGVWRCALISNLTTVTKLGTAMANAVINDEVVVRLWTM